MRFWAKALIGMGVALAGAVYAEFVLDIRTPRSDLASDRAIAAVTSTLIEDQVTQGPEWTSLAGMYGLFVIGPGTARQSVFPFSIVPSHVDSYFPSAQILQDRFGDQIPATSGVYNDAVWALDSCSSPPVSKLGFGRFTEWLRLRAQGVCVLRWRGVDAKTMLISVTIADGGPWMRPFVRWLCTRLTANAIESLAAAQRPLPNYAACVLVDRPDRIRPGDAQDTFEAVVYEVRNHGLSRMDRASRPSL